jgi:flagellar motor protein MotB
MKLNSLRELIKEELKRSLNETDGTNQEEKLKKEINEMLDDILEETQLEEIMTSQINVGDVFTLSSDIGLFKRGDRVKVKDKGMYGNDVKIILSNDQGITDEFLLDINDDFEALS